MLGGKRVEGGVEVGGIGEGEEVGFFDAFLLGWLAGCLFGGVT